MMQNDPWLIVSSNPSKDSLLQLPLLLVTPVFLAVVAKTDAAVQILVNRKTPRPATDRRGSMLSHLQILLMLLFLARRVLYMPQMPPLPALGLQDLPRADGIV